MDIGGIVNQVKVSGGDPKKIVGAVSKMVQDAGGIGAVVSKLKEGGLGDTVSSWVETGANSEADGKRLSNTLGQDRVKQVAKDAGVSEDQAEKGIASSLPAIIDHLTPDGRLPEGDRALSDLRSSLRTPS
jgi:uncharacterized protein YidB (DUF937 family)